MKWIKCPWKFNSSWAHTLLLHSSVNILHHRDCIKKFGSWQSSTSLSTNISTKMSTSRGSCAILISHFKHLNNIFTFLSSGGLQASKKWTECFVHTKPFPPQKSVELFKKLGHQCYLYITSSGGKNIKLKEIYLSAHACWTVLSEWHDEERTVPILVVSMSQNTVTSPS